MLPQRKFLQREFGHKMSEVYKVERRKKDLVLHIYVDEDFASESIEYRIFTFKDGELVDKTEDIYIDKLENELERINFYEDFGIL